MKYSIGKWPYVPKLAKGLMEHIHTEQQGNPSFIAKFNEFVEMCRASINSNIRRGAVEEMLVQHILTERIL